MGFRTPHRCLHAIAPMPLIYKALERFREVKQRLYFVLERSGSGSASGLQARPTRPTHCCPLLPPGTAAARVAARLPCAPQLRTRSEFALRWCAGSFGQAHIQNTNERSMCVAMQALEAGQCVELAPGMPTFRSGLAVAPLRVGGGGPRRLWALLPCDAWRQPWLASSVRGAAASCAMGLHGARHCVDRRRRLRARVPLAPPCPASVVGLV